MLAGREPDIILLDVVLPDGDDYITKPFHPEELLARIDAAMRRRGMDKFAPPILTTGSLTLDLTVSQAFNHNKNLELTPKEFALLFMLFQHMGESVSKNDLYEQVWKQPMLGDSSALRQHISRLKKKLEKDGAGNFDILFSRTDGYSLEYMETK